MLAVLSLTDAVAPKAMAVERRAAEARTGARFMSGSSRARFATVSPIRRAVVALARDPRHLPPRLAGRRNGLRLTNCLRGYCVGRHCRVPDRSAIKLT